MLTKELYFVQGPEYIKSMYRNSWGCSSIPFVKFALEYAFGLPKKAAALYDRDDSGSGREPYAGSTTKPRNRVDYNSHQSMVRFLQGEGFQPFWHRFREDITGRFQAWYLRAQLDWEKQDDLMQLVSNVKMTSVINALCGPHLLRLCPSFLNEFFEFDRYMPTFLQGKIFDHNPAQMDD